MVTIRKEGNLWAVYSGTFRITRQELEMAIVLSANYVNYRISVESGLAWNKLAETE